MARSAKFSLRLCLLCMLGCIYRSQESSLHPSPFMVGGFPGMTWRRLIQCRSRVTMKAVTMDRLTALRMLGFNLQQVEPNAEEIKRAFRQAVRKHHPDRPGGDSARFQEVMLAYNVLTERVVPAQASSTARRTPSGWYTGSRSSNTEEQELKDLWEEIGYNPYADNDVDIPDPRPSWRGGSWRQYRRQPRQQRPPAEDNFLVTFVPVALVLLLFLYISAFVKPQPVQQEQLESPALVLPSEMPQRAIQSDPWAVTTGLSSEPEDSPGAEEAARALMEYDIAAKVAEKSDTPIIYAARVFRPRTETVAEAVQACLARNFKSIVVVIFEAKFDELGGTLNRMGALEGFEAPKFRIISDRTAVRLSKPATNQELLVVGARGRFVSADEDEDRKLTGLAEALQKQAPDLFVFDLREADLMMAKLAMRPSL
eukprot:TRINITY_DN37083_c0_g1_i1.p1 TRINITY_DN37083_c0_g1~~TRINITY_DN37083_c0_g1_i1.p1  ORF type:complete len:426 (-),score=78.77 TRINITY_DN37083_c0_g1_i1:219-1496(-)